MDMLENALHGCPDGLWAEPLWIDPQPCVGLSEFWYVAYHALFWLDLYLTGMDEGFCDGFIGVLQFNVFPNPVSDKLTISGIKSDDLNIRLMNINSGIAWEKKVRAGNNTEIDLSSFLPGIYILTLTSDGETATKKIIVQ